MEALPIKNTSEELGSEEPIQTFVTVNHRDYAYSPENGLDREAVIALDAFIYCEALKFLHSFPGCSLDLEDLVQEGRIGALHSAKRFDPKRGVQFITYASYGIRAAMREAVDKKLIHTPRGQRSIPLTLMDSQKLGAIESVDEFGTAEAHERQDLFERALAQVKKLPDSKSKLVLRYIYGEESLADIAKEVGVSRQRVSQILKECCIRIRAGIAA